VLANVIGTTGASMLLIRPLLRINLVRQHRKPFADLLYLSRQQSRRALTPLGDPPLFLGFLHGVDFFWTLSLWPHWLVVNGLVLAIALVWIRSPIGANRVRTHFRRGTALSSWAARSTSSSSSEFSQPSSCNRLAVAGSYRLVRPWPSVILIAMAILSWFCTARSVREHNRFAWDDDRGRRLIRRHLRDDGPRPGSVDARPREAWHQRILAVLLAHRRPLCSPRQRADLPDDRLPGSRGQDLAALSRENTQVLQAISAGAVFMGH